MSQGGGASPAGGCPDTIATACAAVSAAVSAARMLRPPGLRAALRLGGAICGSGREVSGCRRWAGMHVAGAGMDRAWWRESSGPGNTGQAGWDPVGPGLVCMRACTQATARHGRSPTCCDISIVNLRICSRIYLCEQGRAHPDSLLDVRPSCRLKRRSLGSRGYWYTPGPSWAACLGCAGFVPTEAVQTGGCCDCR